MKDYKMNSKSDNLLIFREIAVSKHYVKDIHEVMIAVPILRSERTLRASSDRALARSSSMAVADLVSVTSSRLSISLSWLLAPVAGGLTSTDASPKSKQIVS